MSARGSLFLGDLVKAVSLLRPQDPDTALAMARLLWLGPGGPESPAPTPRNADPTPVPDRAPTRPTDDEPVPAGPSAMPDRRGVDAKDLLSTSPVPQAQTSLSRTDEQQPLATKLTERPVAFSLTLTRPPSPEAPPEDTGGSHADADELPDQPVESTPTDPPWTPEWARGVMVAAVSAPVASRRIDQRALLRKASRQQVLRSVPWQHRPSTRRGVQFLLDHSPGMAPFQYDRRWLHGLMTSVAGRDRAEVLRFTGSPRRGVVHADSVVREPYRAPAPGTPVVLVSDLGKLRPPLTGERTARLHEWLDFIDQVLRCGCPAVCLTPYPPTAYPAAVRDRIALIPFDRRISLRYAREATRRVHQMLEERT